MKRLLAVGLLGLSLVGLLPGNGLAQAEEPATISITAPEAGALVRGILPVTAAAASPRGVSKVEFRVDGVLRYTDTTAPYAYNWPTTSFPDGLHTLAVTAIDKAGSTATSTVAVPVDNTPPSLVLSPANGTAVAAGVVPVSAVANDLNGVARVDFYVGLKLIGTDTDGSDGWSATWTTTGLLSASYQLRAVATDLAGNSRNVTHSIILDAVGPSISLTTPAAGSRVTGTVAVTGVASDNRRVSAVEIYVDDVLQTTLTPAAETNLYRYQWNWATSGDGPRLLKAVVTDASGNKAEKSLTVHADHTDPTVALRSPADVGQTSPSTLVVADAADNEGVARVDFYLNGDKVASDTVAPYTWLWYTTGLAAGSSHTLTARAYDLVGRTAVSAPVTVTVGGAALPDLALQMDPKPGATPFRGSTTVTAVTTPGQGVNRVDFFIDSALVATATAEPFAFTLDTTTLADGPRRLSALAFTSAGSSAKAEATIRVDNTPPTAWLTNLTPGRLIKGQTMVGLTARDNTRLSRAVAYLDGDQSLSLLNQGLTTDLYSGVISLPGHSLSEGSHTLHLQLWDSAGNLAEQTIPFQVDRTAPTLSLISPAAGAKVGLGTVTLEADTAGAGPIARVDFYVGATNLGSDTDSTDGWTATWKVTPSTASTTYTLKAIAHDPAGNSTTATQSVTVDAAAPALFLSRPLNNSVVQGAVALEARATDNRGIALVEVLVDDQLVESIAPSGAPTIYPYIGTWDSSLAANGAHLLTVRVTDTHGNTTARTATVLIDRTAPDVTLTSPTDGGYVKGSHQVTATLSDPEGGVKKVEVLVDGAVKYTLTQPRPVPSYNLRWNWTTTALAQGSAHDLTIRATDAAGNVQTASAIVRIDRTAPTLTLKSPTPGYVRGLVAIELEAADTVGLDRAELFLGSELLATLDGQGLTSTSFQHAWDSTTKPNGTYTLRMVVYDLAGNTASRSFALRVDNAGPAVKISAPAANATVKGTVAVTATATDPSGVTKLEFYLDGQLQFTDPSSPYRWTWDTTRAANGAHTVMVVAADKAGNLTSTSLDLTVSN